MPPMGPFSAVSSCCQSGGVLKERKPWHEIDMKVPLTFQRNVETRPGGPARRRPHERLSTGAIPGVVSLIDGLVRRWKIHQYRNERDKLVNAGRESGPTTPNAEETQLFTDKWSR